MNTMTTSIRSPRSLIAAAAFTALISGFSAVSNAADATDVPKAIVKYADLDISSSHGAATLYSRIRVASEGLCSPFDHGDLVAKYLWKQCVKQAIEGAVTKVNQPALSAVYAAKFGALQQATILTADRR
jgi:UrcA family protein